MKSVSTANVPGHKNPGYRRHGYGMRHGTSERARSKARKPHADGSGPRQKALRKRAKRRALAEIMDKLDGRYPYIMVAEGSYFHPTVWFKWEIDLVFRDGRLVHPRTIFLSSENSRFINSGYSGSAEKRLRPAFLAGDNAAPGVFFV